MTAFDKRHVFAQFEAFVGNGAGSAPDWLKARRASAIATFGDLGFPSTREEAWRFTSVNAVLNHPYVLAEQTAVSEDVVRRFSYGSRAVQLVFVNGRFDAAHSRIAGAPAGVTAGNLDIGLGSNAEHVERHLGSLAGSDVHGFAALNAAFTAGGAFLHVADGVTVEPEIHILYLTVPDGEPVMTVPRTLGIFGNGSTARIVETYASESAVPHLTNAVTEVVVGANAEVDWYRVQRESDAAFHIAVTQSTQDRDSRYSMITLPFGSRLTRHDVRMVMNGEGGTGRLNGLYVMNGVQHVDHQTVIEHAKPRCDSHEYFNGILNDRSHAVFNGRIIVHRGAQKTDAKQTNNNLLLSESARADSQPQLEIYADDVRCTHGATLGPLDENATFYLQSRGVGADAAREMLTYGFSYEILDGIQSEDLKPVAESLVRTALNRSLRA